MPEAFPLPPAIRLALGGNRPLALDGDGSFWVVDQGELDLFAIARAADGGRGARRHLARLGVGEALFGGADPGGGGFSLLAVGVGDAAVAAFSAEVLAAAWEEEAGRAWIGLLASRWIDGASRSLASRPPSRGAPPPRGVAALAVGDFLPDRGEAVVAYVVEGIVDAGGDFAFRLEAGEDGRALPAAVPVSAPAPARVELFPLSALPDPAALRGLLDRFHQDLLRSLAACAAREAEAERLRQGRQEEALQEAFSGSLRAMAGFADSRAVPGVGDAGPDHLLAAVRAVGREIGVAFSPLPSGEDEGQSVEALARRARVRVREIVLQNDWWRNPGGALVGRLAADNRPVALIPDGARSYRLHDPARPGVSAARVTAASAATLQPLAHLFYRPLPERPLGGRDILLHALRGSGPDLATILAMGILSGLLGMLLPLATGMVFNTLVPSAAVGELAQVAIGLVLAAAATALFDFTSQIALLRGEGRASHALQAALWDRLLSLPPGFFRDFEAGDLAMRVNGVETIRQMLSGAVLFSTLHCFFSVFSLFLLFFYDWRLALLALLLVAVALATSLLAAWLRLAPQREGLAAQGRLSGRVLQLLSGITKLRVTGCEARAFAQWSEGFLEVKRHDIASARLSNLNAAFDAFYGPFAALCVYAAYFFFLKSHLTVGAFLACNAAFGQFMGSLLGMSSSLITLANVGPVLERSRGILTTPPEVDPAKADPGCLQGRIEFANVGFRYRSDGPAVLKDIDLRVEPGEFVAFVGPSGAGKSTLIRLLLGFDWPETGIVSYDGQDLARLDVVAVRRQLGVVLQSSRVLSGDVLHNIIGASRLTLEDAWAAAAGAGLADDIRAMPMGMHTPVSEGGATLSGGQRQRLLIARALVRRPTIVLFDEATSALDNRTQRIVTQTLRQMKATRVVIAQRLGTIVDADRIYVVQDGRIVQQGAYAELSAVEGTFRDLARRQLA